MAVSKKRNAISLDMKLKVLTEVDKKLMSKSEIAKSFSIPKSTLFTIIKNRDLIMKAEEIGVPSSRNRSREGRFQQIEKMLYEWLKLMRSKNIPVDGNLLKSKAQVFAEKMNIDETTFKASDGWLQKFKVRHGISFRKLCGESGSVNQETIEAWKKNKLKEIIDKYAPEDIFNADETGLLYMMKPDKSLIFKDETIGGEKKKKQRITILLCANMSGTEKLPLLVIGKSTNPRCFKGVKTLPVTYRNNAKSWMTATIFEEWLRCLDRQMTKKHRKVVIVVDNCTAHPKINGLKSIKLEYLPPNVTSVLQPLDQGVILSFKCNYRKLLLRRIVSALDENEIYNVDMLTALHLSKAAWNEVTEKTIKNCFRHAGFHCEESSDGILVDADEKFGSDEMQDADEKFGSDEMQDADEKFDEEDEMVKEFSVKMNLTENFIFEEYVMVDNDLECVENLSENDIISRYCAPEDCESSSDEDLPIVPEPNTKTVANAIGTLKCFFERHENSENYLASLTEMENYILKKSQMQKKQTMISDYFSKK